MFNTFIVEPMINLLLLLYQLLFSNYLLAIAVFTILIRALTLPLNVRQQRSMQKTQVMQPKIQAIQKKYKDNPQKMQEEFAKIGYNPTDSLMGCLPMLIQMPVLFGLYRAIIVTLGSTPQSLFELTQSVYEWLPVDLAALLPIQNTFLWLNLGQPDPFYVLPILVFATMWAQQKLLTPAAPPSKDGKDSNPAASMTKSMQTTMPLMFAFFSLQFPSGLSIYFVLSNLVGIAQGYYMRRAVPKDEMASQKSNSTTVSSEPPPSSADKAIAAQSTNAQNGSKNKKKTTKAASNKPMSKRKRRSAKR